MTTVTCCLNRFSGAIRSLPLSDRAIRLCKAAAISNCGRMQTTSRDSPSRILLFFFKSMVVIRIPCGTPSFSTLPNHPVREYPLSCSGGKYRQKKASSNREIHALKRNISLHKLPAVCSTDTSGMYSSFSSPSCRRALRISYFSSTFSENQPAYSCQSCSVYSSSSPLYGVSKRKNMSSNCPTGERSISRNLSTKSTSFCPTIHTDSFQSLLPTMSAQ